MLTYPVIYYRLKQVDFNGRTSNSKINIVRLKKDDRKLIVSPNPFSNYLKVTIDWNNDEAVIVTLLNSSGKVVVNQHYQFTKGLNFIRIDDLQKLSAGNYFIEITSGKDKVSQKIIK